MNRTITTLCCSCLLGVASLAGAQDKMAKDMTKDVKVTGCVAAGTDADHFMLNNAMMAGDMKKEGAAAPMSYALMGGTLKPHVGHKVEVTGKWAEAASRTRCRPTSRQRPLVRWPSRWPRRTPSR